MLKQVWFHIHGKSPEQTTNIMTKILKKLKFIKVNLIDQKCIIQSYEVPDSLNSWLVARLIGSKRFLGKYHKNHQLFTRKMERKLNKIQLKIQTCISRFGFWDSTDYPEDKIFGDFLIRKTQYLIKNMPLWKAVKMASEESCYQISITQDVFGYNTKMDLIYDLMKHHNTTKKQAIKIIHEEFPELIDIKKPKKQKISEKDIENINTKTKQLIELLKFYSPKNRRKYLDDNENFDKFIIFSALFQRNGREWIIENIGEVENWT